MISSLEYLKYKGRVLSLCLLRKLFIGKRVYTASSTNRVEQAEYLLARTPRDFLIRCIAKAALEGFRCWLLEQCQGCAIAASFRSIGLTLQMPKIVFGASILAEGAWEELYQLWEMGFRHHSGSDAAVPRKLVG